MHDLYGQLDPEVVSVIAQWYELPLADVGAMAVDGINRTDAVIWNFMYHIGDPTYELAAVAWFREHQRRMAAIRRTLIGEGDY